MNLWLASRRFLLRLLPVIMGSWIGGGTVQADERLWLTGITINGKVAHFFLDTGTSYLVLFQTGAARLGLSFTNAPKDTSLEPGRVPMGETEVCDLKFDEKTIRTNLPVVEVPAAIPWGADGVVGWGAVSDNILMIDACLGTVSSLTGIPGDSTNWTQLRFDTNSDTLMLEVPSGSKEPSTIAVDTGSECGVDLAPERWQAWRKAHANQPVTLRAYVSGSVGVVVTEEAWAKQLDVGPLVVKDVPVSEANKAGAGLGGSRYQMTLGLAALKRLDLVTDGRNGIAYLRVRQAPPPAYNHNRLGAVFTPHDLQSDSDLIAHVVNGSPAWEAGIRSGDLLLRIDDQDVTKWRTDPNIKINTTFSERPAGTKVQLTLRRGAKTFNTSVVLQQILPPKTIVPPKVSDE